MQEQKLKVSKILVMHLKSTFKRSPLLEYHVFNVALDDELSYTLALSEGIVHATEQVIKKTDVNETKYVQVFSNVDGKTYWHFDVYVYAEIDEGSTVESFMEFWAEELKNRAMTELKDQNQMLKEMHKGIESIASKKL